MREQKSVATHQYHPAQLGATAKKHIAALMHEMDAVANNFRANLPPSHQIHAFAAKMMNTMAKVLAKPGQSLPGESPLPIPSATTKAKAMEAIQARQETNPFESA